MTRVFSGMQPSGDPHLGNLLGAWVNWVAMQDDAECIYCVVDLHAMTSPAEHDPATLRQRTVELATGMLAVGVDPERSILFVQSHLSEHAECTWLFNCVAGFGELRKQPQFKEKSEGRGESVSVGLFDYPVLQTADILLYAADEVPVGEDQRHHIELARDIGQRFNHRFGEVFTLPKAVHPEAGSRVMDLQDPTRKMSKSQSSEKGIVRLLDDPKKIEKKFRSAVTDSATDIRHDRDDKPGVSNLLEILAGATGDPIDKLAATYDGGGYGPFKQAVADAVVERLRPFQDRYRELEADPGEVAALLERGAERARAIAAPTLERAKQAMGLLPPGQV
ncbi:tryptophan--tRNA ligase [Egicoccus halophilus]|uniref:Tryptophan--tRNA ligase n=1 Tax=Egicoccus halophilus TaxID=1670830 RepID=A0A8J3A5S9_9ACTN|nr:tryptophan--tRNA ligase [Egicoccus halophilus]GGI03819.1 tryptophan--tRNA ligase 2 [Egicoccus halophilus]